MVATIDEAEELKRTAVQVAGSVGVKRNGAATPEEKGGDAVESPTRVRGRCVATAG